MTRLRVLVAVLALWTVLGCEDEPTPNIADPSPSSSVASPSGTESSASPSPSVEAGNPVDVTRRWVDAINEGLSTGDTQTLRQFSADECVGCDNIPDGIDEVIQAGGRFEGGEWTFVNGKAQQRKGLTQVTLGVRIAAGQTIPSEGAAPVVYKGDSRALNIDLRQFSGEWLLTKVVFLS